MIHLAVAALLALGKLHIAGKRVLDEDAVGIAAEAPGIILKRAEVEAVEGIGGTDLLPWGPGIGGQPLVAGAVDWIMQLGCAVLGAKEESEGMLGIAAGSAEAAADADAGVDLEAGCAIGIDQLDGCGALPGPGIVAGVSIDAGGGAEHVIHVDADVDRRNRQQIAFDLIFPWREVHDIGIHSIVEALAVSAVGGPGRAADRGRRAVGRLGEHIVQEDVGLGIDVRGDQARFECRGAKRCGFVDGDGSGVEEAGGGGRRTVQGVVDFRAGRVSGDDELEGRVVEAAIDAELGVGHDAVDVGGVVDRAGRWRGHVALAGKLNGVQGIKRGEDQKINVVGRKIEPLDRKRIGAGDQHAGIDRNGDVFKDHRLGVGMARGCDRVPNWRSRRIALRHFHAVDVGDESIVILHVKQQRIALSGIADVERQAHIGRAVDVEHRRLHIAVASDQLAIVVLRGVILGGNSPAVPAIADEREIGGVEGRFEADRS